MRNWHIWFAAAAVLSAVAFTPLVIPQGVAGPFLLGMPRALWAGLLITAGLVFLTYLAGRDAPRDEEGRR